MKYERLVQYYFEMWYFYRKVFLSSMPYSYPIYIEKVMFNEIITFLKKL